MTELGNLDFPRDRWGRPLITVPGEAKPQPYTRISSFGSVLENQFGLNKWRMRTMLRGALDRPDLRARAEARLDDDRFLDDICDQLIEHGGGSKAANLGTAIHEVLSNVNKGLVSVGEVPADFRAHVQAWGAALAAHDLKVVGNLVECQLVNDEFRAAGSSDVFLQRPDGRVVACDIKTGKTISPRPLAYMVQLYLYASAALYDVSEGTREALGDVDLEHAYIAHIPAGDASCTFYEVDLVEARRLALLAAEVKDAEKTTTRVAAITAPVDELLIARRAWIRDRVKHLVEIGAGPDLMARWPEQVPGFKGGHPHTHDEIYQIAKACDPVEAAHNVAFGASDPRIEADAAVERRDIVKIREAFPEAVLVDDQAAVDAGDLKRLQSEFNQLPEECQRWVKARGEEAADAKVSFSLKGAKTQRRYQQFRAAMNLAFYENNDDVIRMFITRVNTKAKPHKKLGDLIGELTHEQVLALQQVLDDVEEGLLVLTWTDNQPTLVSTAPPVV